MINLDKTEYRKSAARLINDYNWVLKDTIANKLHSVKSDISTWNRRVFNIWDPSELQIYINESI